MTEFKGLAEAIVEAVISKLQGNGGHNPGWAGRAALINAQYGDDLGIVAPGVGDYFVGRMRELAMIPAVFVMAGPASFTEQGAHSFVSKYQVNIHIVEQEQTGPRLAKKLMRQERAVIECLYDDDPQEAAYLANQATVLGPYRLFPLRRIPGAVFSPDQTVEAWRGSTELVFNAEQEEM